MSKKKSSSGKWPWRYPPTAAGIQVNHCKNPRCANFGVPPKDAARAVGRRAKGYVAPSPGPGDYIVVGIGPKEPALRCELCNEVIPMQSNLAIAEELLRISAYLEPPSGPACTNDECEFYDVPITKAPKNYVRFGTSTHGTPRYRCKACKSVFAHGGKATHRQRETHRNRDIFEHLVNSVPLRRTIKLLGITPGTLYRRIDFIWRQCRQFAGERERMLAFADNLGKRYITVDRQALMVNWVTRKDRRNTQLLSCGSADLETGYVFGIHLNYDPDLSTDEVLADMSRYGDDKRTLPFRRYARVWLTQDFEDAAKRAVGRKRATAATADGLEDAIEATYADAVSRDNVEAGDGPQPSTRVPVRGMQVHEQVSMNAHIQFVTRLLRGAEKLRFFVDQESGLRAAIMAAVPKRVLDRIYGGTEDDRLFGGAGADQLYGEQGNDILTGGEGADQLYGGAGNDWLGFLAQGFDQADQAEIGVAGAAGNLYDGGTGNDVINGSAGYDTYVFRKGEGHDFVITNGGADKLELLPGANAPLAASDVRFTRQSFDLLVWLGDPADPASVNVRIRNWFESADSPNQLGLVTAAGQAWNRAEINAMFALNGATPDWNTAKTSQPIRRYDPLILDLDGDGVESIGVNQGVYFDHANDGFAESTGWVSPDDGLLVRDINGNGTIDSGRELLGDQTLLAAGTFATNGFTALADLDSNADGMVDGADAVWGELRVWKDTNSDGKSTPDELLALDQLGIASVGTGYTSPNTALGNGNILAQAGVFQKVDGLTGQAGSLLFDRRVSLTIATDIAPLDLTVQGLPNLTGTGKVLDLAQAMMRDPTLLGQVHALANLPAATGFSAYTAAFQEVLYRWVGADATAVGSRGSFVDAKHMKVLESFFGESFLGVDGTGNPNNTAGPQLEASYQQLITSLLPQFVARAQLKPVLAALQAEMLVDGAVVAPGLANTLAATYATSPDEAAAQLAWLMNTAPVLGLSTMAGWSDLGAALEAAAPGSALTAAYPILLANPNANLLAGDSADNAITGTSGADVVLGGAGNDTLSGGNGADLLEGGDGNDTLDGGRDADILRGGAGDDILGGVQGSSTSMDSGLLVTGMYVTAYYSGPGGGNTYEGGTGNDTLRGTTMADLYLFNLGDGADTLIEYEVSGQPAGQVDVLRFGDGIAAADIAVTRSSTDLKLSHVNGTDSVTIKNWFTTAGSAINQVERVEFADGTVWLSTELTERALTVIGTEGADTLAGISNYASILHGNGGNDTITGGTGADQIFGGADNDTLTGGNGADLLEGGDGNDTLDGGRDADILRGGAGDDILGGVQGSSTSMDSGLLVTGMYVTAYYSGPGAGNTYEGGAGNDTLRGTSMADLYLFNLGDGADTLTEYEVTGQPSGQVDVLRFGAGIAAADLVASRVGADLKLSHVNGTDSVTVKNWFTTAGSAINQIERVEFADGTVWTNTDMTRQASTVVGSDAAETLAPLSATWSGWLYGLGGNDTLSGGDKADTLDGGDGDDLLNGGKGADTLIGGTGDDQLGANLPGVAHNIDRGYVLNGVYYGPSALDGNAYIGGTGNDQLYGTTAADLYHFSLGDGRDTVFEHEVTGQPANQIDRIVFGEGILPAGVAVTRSGYDLVLSLAGGTDQVTVSGWYTYADGRGKIEEVAFTDGTVWGAASLSATGLTVYGADYGPDAVYWVDPFYAEFGFPAPEPMKLYGAGDGGDFIGGVNGWQNSLYGMAGSDWLVGGDLADLLDGGAGDDMITGDAGDDQILGGAGADVIGGDAGNDVLDSGVGNDSLWGGAGDDVLLGGDGDDVLGGNEGNDHLDGGNGNDALDGGAGADTLIGGAGHDILGLEYTGYNYDRGFYDDYYGAYGGPGVGEGNAYVGGTGNDLLYGTAAADSYFFNLGDGQDVIFENEATGQPAGQIDRLVFGEGISTGGLQGIRSGSDMVLKVAGGSDQVTLRDWYAHAAGVHKIEETAFADGTVMGEAQLEALVTEFFGTTASENLTATDNIHALIGGQGDDILNGSLREDVFRFNFGDGLDTVNTGDTAGHDILVFEDSFAATTLTASRSADNLLLTAGSGDEVIMTNWFTAGNQASVLLPGSNNLVSAATITNFLTTEGNPNALRIL